MKNDDDLHVMPTDGSDIINHSCSPECECMPRLDPETQYLETKVWVHRLLTEESN